MSTSRSGAALTAALLLGACGGKKDGGPPLSEFVKTNAAKIEAIQRNLRRAVSAATEPEAARAPSDCSALQLVLNGKTKPGNTEVLWADEAEEVLAGKRPSPINDPHLVPRFLVAGWCQQLTDTMYWLTQDNQGAQELEKSGVSAKVRGWMESALDLTYVIVLVPGEHARGEQKVALRAVELATGTVKCAVEVTGRADPSLGVEHYQLVRKSTGEKVGGVQTHNKYAAAMSTSLQSEIGAGLRKGMGVDMRAFCSSSG